MQNNQARDIVNTLLATQADQSSNITAETLAAALSTVRSTTFATLTQASTVKTAAKHSDQRIYKITVQNVTVCNSASSLYNNAVTREAQATEQAQAFTSLPSNYDMIDNSYSIVSLKSQPSKQYLRAIVNRAIQSVFYCANTDRMLSKEQVAEYLTKSAADKLLNPAASTHVQHADVTHTVTARTFALHNIYSINVNKQTLTA